MRRQQLIPGVLVLLTLVAVPALAAPQAPATVSTPQAAACLIAPALQPAPIAVTTAPLLPFLDPALALACTPSPLCPDSVACRTDCRNHGALTGGCSTEGCCICVRKI